MRASVEARRAADPEGWAEQRRAAGARYRAKNAEAIRERDNARRAAVRAEVIRRYGGRCSCPGCHVHHAELLTLDHVEGGARHRQNTGDRSSASFYARVLKAGCPSTYQLLCGSCNLAKADGPACPLAGEQH